MTSPRPLLIIVLAAVLPLLPATAGAQTLYSHGNPSADEQFMLELLNRARANPPAEGTRLGRTDFSGYAPRPPVAFNASLNTAARAHNDDMAAHNYFSHTGSDGSTPATRIRATGYVPGGDGENIADGFSTAEAAFDALMIDTGIPDLGHRRNFLEFDQSSNFFREIGIATVNGANTTQDFGYREGVTLLCGVAYQDNDRNGFYTQGEGLGGIRVTSPGSSYYAVTSASGGYTLPMDLLPANAAAPQTTVAFTLPDGTVKSSGITFKLAANAPNLIAGGRFDNAKVDLPLPGPAFFDRQTALSNGVYYLAFTNGNFFGYYSYLGEPHYIYHFDLGFEYVFDAADGKGGVYFYDFQSSDFFYTSAAFPFPYLYDFNLGSVVYYFPDPSHPGRYNTDGQRYFYVFKTNEIIAK